MKPVEPLYWISHIRLVATIEKDACDKQIGCVLLQEQPNGKDRVVRYWSRLLNSIAFHAIPHIENVLPPWG